MKSYTVLASLLALVSLVEANQRVLLYTAVASDGYRHPSIPDAVAALEKIARDNSIDTIHVNDMDEFADLDFSQFDALAFVNAAGSVLNKKGAKKMRHYIENGGGYVGIHEASCAATSTPWYLRLVGAQFTYHPEITTATMNILDRTHPSTQHLDSTWEVYDEIYNYASDPRKLGATVGVSADESTYWDKITPAAERARMQGSPHPVSWWREGDLLSAPPHGALGGGLDNKKSDVRKGIAGKGGPGRSWYTGLGHTHACWQKEDFLQHVFGGLKWVLASTTIASNQLDAGEDTPGQKYNGTTSDTTSASAGSTGASVSTSSATGSAPPTINGTALHANSSSGVTSGAMTVAHRGPGAAIELLSVVTVIALVPAVLSLSL